MNLMDTNNDFLKDIWGGEPLFAMSEDNFYAIKEQYPFYSKQTTTIDDITWNDFELDKIFTHMNSTLSNGGDFTLYQMLRTPCMNQEDLNKRIAIMNWAKKNAEEREKVKEILFDIDKRYQDRMENVLDTNITNPRRRTTTIVLIVTCILAFVLVPFLQIMVVPAVLLLLINIFRSFYLHKQLSPQIDALVYCIEHVHGLHQIAKKDLKLPEEFQEELSTLSKKLHKIHRTSALDYFDSDKAFSGFTNFIFQREALKFDQYANNVYDHRELVKDAILLVGKLDALISVASYEIKMKANHNIKLTKKGASHINAIAMVHPMISNAITNDVDIKENRLITGSNATGKSSYLKMVAINALFAQCFSFVFAKSYDASFFHIVSSMALRDNIFAQESYFMSEIKSLKRMMDSLNDEEPTLCIIDEILRGTNTLERIAASTEILHTFAHKNAIVLGATHDIELTRLLEDDYANYHFRETMKKEKMLFDYKIHKGPSTSRNAIALLSLLGYRQDIVKKATAHLQYFETKGSWETI